MGFGMFVLIVCLIFFVLYVTKVYNFWGLTRGTKKARADVAFEKRRARKAKRASRWLSRFVWVNSALSFSSNRRESDYIHKIERIHWRIKSLDRLIKPAELFGLLKTVQIFGVFLTIGLFVLTGSIFSLVFAVFLFAPMMFNAFVGAKISDEDDKLELEFPDFYTVLYSRLLRGSHMRLAPTLKDFLHSLDSVGVTSKSKKVIRNFVVDLRNNIEVYGDDSIAITKLRSKYKSAMVVNFCNLASQAISGVDNSDKLLSFKIELNSRRAEEMEKRANILAKRGSRAVLLVYLILFQFLIISWVAKLSIAGGLRSVLGV